MEPQTSINQQNSKQLQQNPQLLTESRTQSGSIVKFSRVCSPIPNKTNSNKNRLRKGQPLGSLQSAEAVKCTSVFTPSKGEIWEVTEAT